MKIKIPFLTVLALAIAVLAGCGTPQSGAVSEHSPVIEEQVTQAADYVALYQDTLEGYSELITDGFSDKLNGEGEIGVLEIVSAMEAQDGLNAIGYSIQDISGDNIPELIIAPMPVDSDSMYYGSQLLAVYTIADNAPQLAFEGWARSSYTLLENNELFYSGSGGAAYSSFGRYTLTKDGSATVCSDFFFTDIKDEESAEISIYHNTTGEWNIDVSEELNITVDEFSQLRDSFSSPIQNIDLIPFSEINK